MAFLITKYFHPVHTGHFHVQQNNGHLFFRENIEAFFSPAGREDMAPHSSKYALGTDLDTLLIIHNQYSGCVNAVIHFSAPYSAALPAAVR
jgi:hypothetical protein